MTAPISSREFANIPTLPVASGRKDWERKCGATLALITFVVAAASVVFQGATALGIWKNGGVPSLPLGLAIWISGFSGCLSMWLGRWLGRRVWRRLAWGLVVFLAVYLAWLLWSTGESLATRGWKLDPLANLWEGVFGMPLVASLHLMLGIAVLVMVSHPKPASRANRYYGLVGLVLAGLAGYFLFEQSLSPHVWHDHGFWTPETLSLSTLGLLGLSLACLGGWTRGVVWAVREVGYIVRHDRKDTSAWMGRGVLVLLVGGLLVTGWTGTRYLKEGFLRERQLAEERLQQVAELVGDAVEVWQRERIYDTRVLAHSPVARLLVNTDPTLDESSEIAGWRQSLELWHQSYGYEQVAFYDVAQRLVWSSPGGVDVPLRAGLQVRGSDGEVEWASSRAGSETTSLLVYLSPVRDEAGELAGWLRMSIFSHRSFAAVSASDVARAQGMHTWFTRQDGGGRVYAVETGDSQERLVETDSLLHEASRHGTPGRLRVGTDESGQALMAIVTPLAGSPWQMVTACRVEDVVYQMREQAWHARTTTLLVVVLVLLTTVTMMRRRRDLFRLQDLFNKEHDLNTMKTRFISVASHEFRTPVTVAMGSIELLENHRENLTPDKQQELLTRVRTSMKHITAMLDDILTLSRLDVRKTEAKIKAIDLVRFVEDVVGEVRLADGGRHRFSFESEGELRTLRTDPALLRHILQNLIENAARYSPDDTEVSVAAHRREGEVIVAVSDEGRGISPEDLKRIFEPFERGTNSDDTRGTGLGLNIVNRMADLLGGKVEVESVVNVGSVFTVRLPLDKESDLPAWEMTQADAREPES